MFLKSLTLRGFKSFADKTTLVFEPGISILVGPNGSGKTNIVDSISWVLGEQGPRALRGGKMEDVIFAGSRLRPALGMAEVTLTIDNSAGILPIDFTEVTISRTLFRSGESEYRLNGAVCRLLDIQEVLSDTGIGREQHTIIGQGQLDQILVADPMTIRSFIEEAAGIAKHRRRKDRALRKIESTEQNMARLSDLLSEIRRQLRPLREQAEVAKRHRALADDLQRVRLVQLSRELSALRAQVGRGGPLDLEGPIRAKERELAVLESRLSEAEQDRTDLYTRIEQQREVAWSLARLEERIGSLMRLATERERALRVGLAGASEAASAARIADMEREMASVQAQVEEAVRARSVADSESATRLEALQAAKEAARAAEDALAPLRGTHRESIAEAVRIRSEIGVLERTLLAAEHERYSVSERRAALQREEAEANALLETERASLLALESEEEPAARAVGDLEGEITQIDGRRIEIQTRLVELRRQHSEWRARASTRDSSGDAARRIVALRIEGVEGVLADLAIIPGESRAAIEALAGPAEGVVVVGDAVAVRRVASALEPNESMGVLAAAHEPPPAAPAGTVPLTELIEVENEVAVRALARVFVAPNLAAAATLAGSHPHLVFVTREGGFAAGGIVASGSAAAAERASLLDREIAQVAAEAAALEADLGRLRDEHAAAVERLNEKDAHLSAVAERFSGLDREVHALGREVHALAETEQGLVRSAAALTERLENLRARLPALEGRIESENLEVERLQEDHARAVAASEAASAAYEDARMHSARAAERHQLLDERLRSLDDSVRAATDDAAGLEERRQRLDAAIGECGSIATSAAELRDAAARWAAEAEAEYQVLRSRIGEADAMLAGIRTERAALAGAIEDMRARARREEGAASEFRIRARIIEERLREGWQIEPDQAVARFGHRWEVEDEGRITDPVERLALLDDDALARRRVRLERDVESIGRVNPLAAQEFDSLAERERFLGEQMADLRASRRHLLRVVAEVDTRVRDLFVTAFEDVAREYERLFTLLFPGGQGRLRLADPADPLATGVEVEARPGGKNLRRLSLLSGGEKALSALAYLFAIFRARPSPFYVLDEVEAALDDVNLHRFLGLLLDFRETSQLIVVTHQKRTMEVGDVLYGTAIRPDGSSRVISERLSADQRQDIVTPAPSDS